MWLDKIGHVDRVQHRLTLSYLRALQDALRETFLKVTNNEMLTAKRHQITITWVEERIVGRIEKKGVREGGGGW